MSTYKHEMDKIRLSEQGKKRMLALYSSEVKKEEHDMKRFIKPVAAAAACAAILLGYTVSGNMAVKEGSSQQNAKDDHAFTMLVNAEELKEDSPVLTYSGDELNTGWAMSGETVRYPTAWQQILPARGKISKPSPTGLTKARSRLSSRKA